jgi:hypothetical protein
VTIAGCGFADTFVTGGVALPNPYRAISNTSVVTTSVSGGVVRVTRVPGSPAPSTPGTVTILDNANNSRTLTVNVTGTC